MALRNVEPVPPDINGRNLRKRICQRPPRAGDCNPRHHAARTQQSARPLRARGSRLHRVGGLSPSSHRASRSFSRSARCSAGSCRWASATTSRRGAGDQCPAPHRRRRGLALGAWILGQAGRRRSGSVRRVRLPAHLPTAAVCVSHRSARWPDPAARRHRRDGRRADRGLRALQHAAVRGRSGSAGLPGLPARSAVASRRARIHAPAPNPGTLRCPSRDVCTAGRAAPDRAALGWVALTRTGGTPTSPAVKLPSA